MHRIETRNKDTGLYGSKTQEPGRHDMLEGKKNVEGAVRSVRCSRESQPCYPKAGYSILGFAR